MMTFGYSGPGALDYDLCRYGNSRLTFRGPKHDLDRPYAVVLGGTESFGKFIPEPYPALIYAKTGLPVVNLACVNAGIDVYLKDPDVLRVAANAQVCVLQIVGAQNLTNRFYTVHQRRNDRFLLATPRLRSMFPRVDFADFNFTRHMLETLQAVSVDKFEVVAEELRAAWVARMKSLLEALPNKTILLWLGNDEPPLPGIRADLRQDPLLIDQEMIATIKPFAAHYMEFCPSIEAVALGNLGMVFSEMDEPAARVLPGAAVHRELAETLGIELLKLL